MAQAQALQQTDTRDSSLFAVSLAPARAGCGPGPRRRNGAGIGPLCAGCRAKEARYGFRPDRAQVEASGIDRPRTLCFDCFRMEIDRRQPMAAAAGPGLEREQVGAAAGGHAARAARGAAAARRLPPATRSACSVASGS